MEVRDEQPSDLSAIGAVHESAFPTPAEARLVGLLRRSGNLTVSLVAVDKDEIVGHLALSPVTVSGQIAGLGLAPVAVKPQYQKQGIGKALVEAGLKAAKRRREKMVVLLGDPGYYQQFGFKAASAWSLRDEYAGGDAFQALELEPRGIPACGGLVRYCTDFAALEDTAQ